jgi:hypothetical protein
VGSIELFWLILIGPFSAMTQNGIKVHILWERLAMGEP